jgi:hypothetical protein
MYPYLMDPDTLSSAERRLFPVFERYLDRRYTVFHGSALQEIRATGGVEDREIDFLIAHPEHGLLVLEVKGGQITVDGRSGKWLQNGKPMKRSPIRQARETAYALLEYLQTNPQTVPFHYPTWHAVAFPNVDIQSDLGPDAPRDILLDRGDCKPARLTSAIERTYQHYRRNDGKPPPGEKGIMALAQVLAPSYFLRSFLARDFEDEEQQIKRLTEEQYDVLTDFERTSRLLVTGCAGSGKTMLALEKARRLVESGQEVLLVCYNRPLAEWLNNVVPAHDRLRIQTFHSLCREICGMAGRHLSEYQEQLTSLGITRSDFYGAVMPNALHEALEQVDRRYDAIIVDEGQDFRSTFWAPLMALLRDPDRGTFYIFCDDNQRIYSRDALPFTEPRHHLRRNLRNTLEIGLMVGNYHRGMGRYEPAGPESQREPEFVDLEQFTDRDHALAVTLEQLIAEGVTPPQIIILSPLESRSHWKDGMRVGQFTLSRGTKCPPDHIAVETIFAFKGLERPVVILTELERWLPEDRDSLLYVALSRARNHLIVLGKLPEPEGTAPEADV